MTDQSESDKDIQKEHEEFTVVETQVSKEWKWKKSFFLIILPITILVGSTFFYGDFDLGDGDIISNEVYDLFQHYDANKDGSISPSEFQVAYFEIQAGKANQLGVIMEREKQNVCENFFDILSHLRILDLRF